MIKNIVVSLKLSLLVTTTLLISCGGDSNDTTQTIQTNPTTQTSVNTCNTDKEYFCFSRDGGDALVYQEMPSTIVVYDPYIYSRYLQRIGTTAIGLQHDVTTTALPYGLTLTIAASAPGTYYLDGTSINTAAYYVKDNAIPYTYVLPAYTSGTVTIDSYGDVGGYITGHFEMTLCSWSPTQDTAICADTNNLTTIKGSFTATRESDVI